MKRSSDNPEQPSTGFSSDGVDEEIWHRVGVILAAGQRGDPDEFSRLWQDLDREVPGFQRGLAGVYVWYLMWHRVAELLGRKPTPEDLHELAERIYPRFAQLIRWDQQRLEDTLATVFQYAPADRQVTGGELYVAGSAIVSILLDDPSTQMAAIRAPLARWYARNGSKLIELGVT